MTFKFVIFFFQMLVDCGENGLSTLGNHGQNDKDMCYALVKDEPNYRVRSLYQDVGVVEAISGDLDFKNYPIGSVIQLLPWHVCIIFKIHQIVLFRHCFIIC